MLNNKKILPERAEKALLVQNLFNKIAPIYDLVNSIISFGMHKHWKEEAVSFLDISDGDKILDLCCGSGDISGIIAKNYDYIAEIKAVDFSESMLEIAEKKLKNYNKIELMCADAMNLPFCDGYFDCVIISFGLRNLENLNNGLKEINRVLKKSGRFVCLDFGKPEHSFCRYLFENYFDFFVPVLGFIFKSFPEYVYLPDSIRNYPEPSLLMRYMEEAGFCETCNYNRFMGFVSIQTACKL